MAPEHYSGFDRTVVSGFGRTTTAQHIESRFGTSEKRNSFGWAFHASIQCLVKLFSPLPVSRKDFMLESTRDQPQETSPTMGEPTLNLS